MNAILNGIFVGAEQEITVQKGEYSYRVQNATFQEVDEHGHPIPGRYLIVEFWNENTETLKDFRIGGRVTLYVEVITKRKIDKPERYRTRVTFVSMSEPGIYDDFIIS